MVNNKWFPKRLFQIGLAILSVVENVSASETASCPGLLDINAAFSQAQNNRNQLEFVGIEFGAEDTQPPLARILIHSGFLVAPYPNRGILAPLTHRIFFRNCSEVFRRYSILDNSGAPLREIEEFYQIDRTRSNTSRLTLINGRKRFVIPRNGETNEPLASDQEITLTLNNGALATVSRTRAEGELIESCTQGHSQNRIIDQTVTLRLPLVAGGAMDPTSRRNTGRELNMRIANLYFQGRWNVVQPDTQISPGPMDHRGCPVSVITEPRREPVRGGGSCNGCNREPSEEDVDAGNGSRGPINPISLRIGQ
jgi:hypothetical protein